MHATPDVTRIATVAIDLAKDVFELASDDAQEQFIGWRRLTRTAFAKAFDNAPPRRIVMEACGTAHYWARRFQRSDSCAMAGSYPISLMTICAQAAAHRRETES